MLQAELAGSRGARLDRKLDDIEMRVTPGVAETVAAVLWVVRLEAFARFREVAAAVAVHVKRRAVQHHPHPLLPFGSEDQERIPRLFLVAGLLQRRREVPGAVARSWRHRRDRGRSCGRASLPAALGCESNRDQARSAVGGERELRVRGPLAVLSR